MFDDATRNISSFFQWLGPIILLTAFLSAGYLLTVDRLLESPASEFSTIGKVSMQSPSGGELGGVPGEQVAISESSSPVGIPYLLYLPTTWKPDAGKLWPVLIFLHGQGESGSDPNEVRLQGPPALVENKGGLSREGPSSKSAGPAGGEKENDASKSILASHFVVVSPQKQVFESWSERSAAVTQLVQILVSQYSCDVNRVYLTGISAGGFGTWAMAAEHPEVFAAAVPICGGGKSEWGPRLKSMPLWVFHGVNDIVVPVGMSDRMVKAVREAGNKEVTYNRIENAPGRDFSWEEAGIPEMPGHASWVEAYYGEGGEKLYTWLLSQSKDHS